MALVVIIEDKNLDMITSVIESYFTEIGLFLKLTRHAYLLKTDSTPVEVRDNLKKYSEEVEIFISQLTTPAAWRNIDAESDEIKNVFRS